MHCEVREEDDEVLLHSDDEAGVALVSPSDHLDVVAHAEVFPQLVSWELQGVLWDNRAERYGERQQRRLQLMARTQTTTFTELG